MAIKQLVLAAKKASPKVGDTVIYRNPSSGRDMVGTLVELDGDKAVIETNWADPGRPYKGKKFKVSFKKADVRHTIDH